MTAPTVWHGSEAPDHQQQLLAVAMQMLRVDVLFLALQMKQSS